MSKKVPQTLQGKLIAITAIEPGAGKSYSKVDRVNKLRADGYNVKSLGTTQIVSQDQTLCSYLRLYDNKTNEFKKYEDVRKLHSKTSAFIFIDEAWMMSQEYIDALKEDFPKCCFIIIGDPSQLEGVDTTSNGKSVISSVDLNIELQGSHRTSDERLLNFMHELKSGRINFDLLKDRIRPMSDKDMLITYTHESKNIYNYFKEYYRKDCRDNYFYSMKGEFSNNGKLKFHKNDKEWSDSWKNMELWKVTEISAAAEFSLVSITDNRIISNIPLEIFKKYFHNAAAVNIHKVQGISLKDTTISLWPYDSNFKGSYRELLRQLYVMVSRASSWDNIGISQEMYNKLYKKFATHLSCPLNFEIRANTTITCTSEELCNLSNFDFIDLLNTTSADSPTGNKVGRKFMLSCYNMREMSLNLRPPKSNINLNNIYIGTRKSGGRGHKLQLDLTRKQRENIADYLKQNNGQLNPSWSGDHLLYATNWLNNHPEYLNKEIIDMDKYDEIINEDINKRDLVNGNERYAKYILSLRKQYNEILDDILNSLNKSTPSSQNREELKKYLNSYSGKRGIHIVYVYENFNVNLAKNIVKGLDPEFKFDYDTFIVRNK